MELDSVESFRVFIGIPTYNRPEKLRNLLKSIQEQSHKNIKVLISDNGSDAALIDYASEFPSLDIEYHRQQSNIGLIENFRYVFDKSHDQYFMWLSDDDHISKEYVKSCLMEHLKESLALVSGGVSYVSDGEVLSTEYFSQIMQEDPLDRLKAYMRGAKDNGIFYGMYNRKIINFFRQPKLWAGDVIYLSEVSLAGKIKIVKDATIFRSIDGASRSIDRTVNVLALPSRQKYLAPYSFCYEFYRSISVGYSLPYLLSFSIIINYLAKNHFYLYPIKRVIKKILNLEVAQ